MFWSWGSWQSGRGSRWGGGFFLLPLFLCCGANWMLNSGRGFSWIGILLIVLVLFSALPMLMRAVNQGGAAPDWMAEKRKNDEDVLVDADAPPQREPRYILGSDGELIEVDDDDKPKRDDLL